MLSAQRPYEAQASAAFVVKARSVGATIMRVFVYVDGFNLYYRALKGTPFRWLNLDLLAKRLVRPGDTIDRVRYFTARVKARAGDPDAPRRQQVYLSASGRCRMSSFISDPS